MNRKPVELDDDDWGVLFPGIKHSLGNKTLKIIPLSVESIASLLDSADELKTLMLDKGITDVNYMEPQHLVALSKFLLEKAPEHVAESAGISVDIVRALPLPAAMGLVGKVIKVNVDSSDDLVKNFKTLADQFKSLKEKSDDLKESRDEKPSGK